MASPNTIILLIVVYHGAIGGKTLLTPPLCTPLIFYTFCSMRQNSFGSFWPVDTECIFNETSRIVCATYVIRVLNVRGNVSCETHDQLTISASWCMFGSVCLITLCSPQDPCCRSCNWRDMESCTETCFSDTGLGCGWAEMISERNTVKQQKRSEVKWRAFMFAPSYRNLSRGCCVSTIGSFKQFGF